VIAPGSEDLIGPTGEKAKVFLVSTRPGMVYEAGTSFVPVAQIDPILPATVKFTLSYPDGKLVTTLGTGDSFGSFAGQEKWLLDVPGIYRFWIEADWKGYRGFMPGLHPEGGEFYVIEKARSANAQGLRLDLPSELRFSPSRSLTISGTSTASSVHFAAVIPGAVIDQGDLAVNGGKFEYCFDPAAINKRTPTYDIINLMNGRPEIGKIVHLTFFSREISPEGLAYHSFARLIIRGNKVLYIF